MFGTLKPHRCTLDPATHESYRAFYCGLCHALATHHGQLSRATLSRDAVFVALLADALSPEPADSQRRRCPLTMMRARPVPTAEGVPMRIAAHVQVLLADQWLADRAADGRVPARVLRPLAAPAAARARRGAAEIGLPADRLVGFEDRQTAVEVPGVTGPGEAAEPTALALDVILGSLAAADAPDSRGALRRLGRAIGRVIYLTDALEDLRRDHLRGEFNPCLSHSRAHGQPMPSATRVRAARRLLARELAVLPRLLNRLPLQRHRDLLRNILCDQLRGRALRAGRVATQWTSRSAHDELLHWRARPRLVRAAVILLTATLGVWGFTRQAAAAVFHMATRTVGRATPGRLELAEPPWPVPHADSPCQRLGDRIVEFIRDCCDIIGDCFESAVDGCSGCCGLCEECQKACNGCTDSCDDCCNSCDSCGDDCGSCCDGCDDCGNCCNDCDGCCNDCG